LDAGDCAAHGVCAAEALAHCGRGLDSDAVRVAAAIGGMILAAIAVYIYVMAPFGIGERRPDKDDMNMILEQYIAYVEKEDYTMEEINDYIIVVNKYLKQEKVKSLERELKNEIDPIKKAEILNRIMEVKGVKAC